MLSFRMDDDFVDQYRGRPLPFGNPCGGGNSLGEVTFLRTYSRRKPDGTKETWVDVCRRVIEGMYSIQRDHCEANRIPWSLSKARRSAREAFDRLFHLKWSPPGRGLWTMGTDFVHERGDSSSLQNCGAVSTGDNIFHAMAFLMEASMLGVGIGFDDTATGRYTIRTDINTGRTTETFVIPDSREGWVESVELLLRSLLEGPSSHEGDAVNWEFDYSRIRPAGEPIRGFGGTAAGPDPLRKLHEQLRDLFSGREGEKLDQALVCDIGTLIGRCVVAGNVRRSALLYLGEPTDQFMNLKHYGDQADPGPAFYRREWGGMSNNSIVANGHTDYDAIASRVADNGEPGLVYRHLIQSYGRLADPVDTSDHRAVLVNPCGEQALESGELCTLVETYPNRADSPEDYQRTLKFAYLYGKTVTLLPTRWEKTNAIMLRNRRIGLSMTGIARFAEDRGVSELRRWMDEGYETVGEWDRIYSEWLCVRESVRTTTVKPSGTLSTLAGETPGVHFPTHRTYIRRVRFSYDDPLVAAAQEAGYHVEPEEFDPTTAVVSFPVRGPQVRTEHEVSVWEKAALAATAQRWWADNQVSTTLTFSKDEAGELDNLLRAFEGQLKVVSFLPMTPPDAESPYNQLPFEAISEETYERMTAEVGPIDLDRVYQGGIDAVGEYGCTTDVCERRGVPA